MGLLCEKSNQDESIESFQLNSVSINDIPQLKEIFISCWGKNGLYKDSTFKAIIGQKMSYAYKSNKKVIAFCLMCYRLKKDNNNNTNNNMIEVALLCVREEYRHQKLGSSLLSFCINNCKKYNFQKVTLHVSSTNLPAFSLYKKLGFIVESFHEKYYHDENPKDNDAYFMTKNI